MVPKIRNTSNIDGWILDMYHNPKPCLGNTYVTVEYVARFIGETVEQVLANNLQYRILCLGARLFDGVELYNLRVLENYFFLDDGEPDYDYRY